MLIFAAVMTVMISVASAILTAAGRPSWAMLAALPIAPLALGAHLLVIPRYGARGATVVTLVVAAIGAGLALVAVRRAWQVSPSPATLLRVLVATAVTLSVGNWWRTTGALLLLELAVMSAVAATVLIALGELTPDERQLAWSAVRRPQLFTSSTRRLF